MVAAVLQSANVAYFQRKIQLSGFSACPDGSPSELIRICGVLLYTYTRVQESSVEIQTLTYGTLPATA